MFVTAGENIVDMIMGGDGSYKPVAGGSSLNIALGLGRLGQSVGYAMPVSADRFGTMMLEALASAGVKYLPAQRPARPSGLALVSVDDEGQPDYTFYREGAADVGLQPGELPRLGAEVRALQVGGSLVLGVHGCGELLVDWVVNAPDSLIVALDPNVRPRLVADRDFFLAQCEAIVARNAIVRLSLEDADYMYGTEDADQIADLLLAGGACIAVVTLGSQGALLANSRHRIVVPAANAGQLRDTVAAGDCFLAALLTRLGELDALDARSIAGLDEARLGDLGAFAAAGAAYNCAHKGCNPATREQLEQLVKSKI